MSWDSQARHPCVTWLQGHTAHATEEEARDLVLKILGWYRCIYEDLMAVPVIPGWKSEKEKFDGADATSTIEVRSLPVTPMRARTVDRMTLARSRCASATPTE